MMVKNSFANSVASFISIVVSCHGKYSAGCSLIALNWVQDILFAHDIGKIWGKLKCLTRNILSLLEIFWNSFQFTDSSCVWTKPFRIVLHHFCVLCVAFCITRTRPKGHFLQNQVQKDQANDMFAYNSIPVNISPCNNLLCRCVEMLLHLKMSNITNCYGNLHNSWSRKKVKEIVWESIGHNCMRHYYCMLIVVVIMRGSGQRDAAADKQLTTVGDCIKTCLRSSNWSLVTPHLVLSRSSNVPSPSLKLYV